MLNIPPLCYTLDAHNAKVEILNISKYILNYNTVSPYEYFDTLLCFFEKKLVVPQRLD